MKTEVCYWLLCFVPLDPSPTTKIFGFPEFLTAAALLAVIYTIADVRYKFRIAVTPGSLYVATFVLSVIIGLQTLLTEVWIAEGWWVPKNVWLTSSIWQGIFGLLFLATFLTWMYYAFIRPPVFGRSNARRFTHELYRYIHRGSNEELKVVANELARSAKPLIKYSRRISARFRENDESDKQARTKPRVEDFAHDILLLIANRKFCRQIVAVTPVTAQAFFEEMTNLNKFDVPMGQFARNISSEAVAQKGSFLYEEAEGYTSGLLGYLKPVSIAVYGDYNLVESLASNVASPLDIDYEEQLAWDAKQWEAYCRATLITLNSSLKKGLGSQNSYTMNRAIHNIKSSYQDLYKLNNLLEIHETDIYKRLNVVVNFVKDAIDLIDNQKIPPKALQNIREDTYPKNIYDQLAMMVYDLCFEASTVNSPPDTCWTIHHNMIWSQFFSTLSSEGAAWVIVRFKVRRLLYDEIARLTDMPNYKGARVLGYCLQVLGLTTGTDKKNYGRNTYALARAVQSWVRKGYLCLRQKNPNVAESVLIGSLSFDKASGRLVKTYFRGLNLEPPKEYLDLE